MFLISEKKGTVIPLLKTSQSTCSVPWTTGNFTTGCQRTLYYGLQLSQVKIPGLSYSGFVQFVRPKIQGLSRAKSWNCKDFSYLRRRIYPWKRSDSTILAYVPKCTCMKIMQRHLESFDLLVPVSKIESYLVRRGTKCLSWNMILHKYTLSLYCTKILFMPKKKNSKRGEIVACQFWSTKE